MATITTITTAVPPYRLSPDDTKRLIPDVFRLDVRTSASISRMVDNSGIANRYTAFPAEYMIQPRNLTQDTNDYRDHAVILATCVVGDCLKEANLKPTDIDVLVVVSCTGVIMPSIDAYLMNNLGFRPNVIRIPITELGCMGGAAAISRARELGVAYPSKNIMVISVELPSLTYQHDDPSPANVVSSSLFGDGAVCVLVAGNSATSGIEIVDTESCFFPETLDAMGFDLRTEGLHIVLSKDVPTLIRTGIRTPVDNLLSRHNLSIEQVSAWVLHPGGRKILECLEQELQLPREMTQPSWDILRDYGNMSSAAVLFVLREWLAQQNQPSGSYGMMAAFGPGLSAELVLLRWR
ncbi:MAG: 3-oxoacyl-[acyl-carrier-protein] synthase III C-terminal domain-containing protein [Chloroflexota bacterium]